MHVEVVRGSYQMAHLDALHPRVLHHFLNGGPLLRIRLQHLADQRPTPAGIQVVDRRGE